MDTGVYGPISLKQREAQSLKTAQDIDGDGWFDRDKGGILGDFKLNT